MDFDRMVKGLPPIPKVSFEATLGKHILPSACVGCGSCIVVCPLNCLEYIDEKPVLVKECKSCGICTQTCPRYNLSLPTLEKLVFGRERRKEEDFGVYRRIVISQTKDESIMKTCQDGGIVTTLLVHALEDGIIDGAIVSGVSEREPLRPIPKLADTKDEIMGCAGTRYTYSPNVLAFKEGIERKKKSLVFVGTPCEIHAVRKIQALPLRKYSDALGFTVGVFCSECFRYDGLVNELIKGKLGIDPVEVRKVNIKGKLIITTKTGANMNVALQEAKEYACNCASACPDFSAELADISVGGLGLDGWTLTVLRTEKGEGIFQKAESKGLITTKPVDTEKRVTDLLVKLSRKKRENAMTLFL